VRERLILCVSSSVSPSAPDSATRSLPAKSTKCIFPNRSSDGAKGEPEPWGSREVEVERMGVRRGT
jgi:hypothetical protein